MNLVPIRELATFKHGGTPSKAKTAYWQGDIPWVSPKDMKRTAIGDATDHISTEAVKDSATSLVPVGSILIVVRSGILAHSLPVAQVTKPLAFNQDIKAVLPKLEAVNPEYLFWFLKAQERDIIARGVKKGATVHSIQSGFIESLMVPLPALPEQQRIVDLLTRAEGIVRLRREAVAKAAELIPAIFIDMFGDPAVNPKGWPVVALGDLLAEPPTLGTMKKPTLEPQPWLDLRVANIQGGQLRLADKKWLDLTPDEVARFELRADDIILARAIGSLDHLGKAVVVNPDGPWTFDSHLMRVRVNQSRLLPKVLTTFLETASGRREFLSRTRRSAVQFNINGKELRLLKLPLPPIDLQAVFAQRFEEVSSIARQQTDALAKAQATFNALLAQAFAPHGGL